MKYAWSTIRHKLYVLQAAIRMYSHLDHLVRPSAELIIRAILHDMSKFGCHELKHYDRHFFGDKGDEEGFARAWLHHQNSNDHHWEYWLPRTEHTDGSYVSDGCLRMPDVCVDEMVCDWLAASKLYTGSWNMDAWLEGNLGKIRLHPDSRRYLLKAIDRYRLCYLHEREK